MSALDGPKSLRAESADLPTELVLEILEIALIARRNDRRFRWATQLFIISRPVYELLRPLFYRQLIVTPRLVAASEAGVDIRGLEDVRELYVFDGYGLYEPRKQFCAALPLSRIY